MASAVTYNNCFHTERAKVEEIYEELDNQVTVPLDNV